MGATAGQTPLVAPGSTLLVSNLGLVAHDGVERVDFWPVATGPAGVCLGLASSPSVTSVTVRVRRSWFDHAQAARLMEMVGEQVERAGRSPTVGG